MRHLPLTTINDLLTPTTKRQHRQSIKFDIIPDISLETSRYFNGVIQSRWHIQCNRGGMAKSTNLLKAISVAFAGILFIHAEQGSCGGGGGGGDTPGTPGNGSGYIPAIDNTIMAPGVTGYDVVRRFAPVWYQDVDFGPNGEGGRGDVITNVDYDGDTQHNNNWDNLAKHDLYAYLYYALVATESHYYLTFSHYHPRDWELICSGLFTECHEGDMESIRIIVKRDSTGYGKVVVAFTGAHGEKYAWSNPGDGVSKKSKSINGQMDFESDSGAISNTFDNTHSHLRIYSQERGHGPIPCRANESQPTFGYFGFFEGVRCKGKSGETGFNQGNGIIYKHFEQVPDAYTKAQAEQNLVVNYALIHYADYPWAWRQSIGSGKVFRSEGKFQYKGARGGLFTLPYEIGYKYDGDQFVNDSTGGNAAWNIKEGGNQGDAFFDPAYAFGNLFNFDHPVSLNYTYEPYIPAVVSQPNS